MEEMIGFSQTVLGVTILRGAMGFYKVERRCELEIQITFQKHFREQKQSYKAVFHLHKDPENNNSRGPS